MPVRGGNKFQAQLQKMAGAVTSAQTVKVGWMENATYPNGTKVAMVAAIQEFGAPRAGIPPRPFFRNMIAAKSHEWGPAAGALLVANGYDATATLNMVGEGIAGQLRQSIVDTNTPPLSPVTLVLREFFWTNPWDIRARDVAAARDLVAQGHTASAGTSTKPLVWTGMMLNSIDHEVT
jgi:hypothetical protein